MGQRDREHKYLVKASQTLLATYKLQTSMILLSEAAFA